MAEGFELYHVPQQSRRDKLRVSSPATPHHNNNSFHHFHQQQQQQHQHQHHSGGGGGGGGGGLVVPFYDPSIHLDLLTCATNNGFQHPQSSHLLAPSENPSVIIKGEGPGFMGFLGNPQSQNQTNHNSSSPTLINTNDPQFFYHAQAREFGPSSSSSSSLYRPEPLVSRQGLSLSLSSHNTHLPMEVNFQYSAPPGPFTGYTSVLKCSIFLRPAQQLLQEICDASGFCSAEKMEPDLSLLDPPCFDNYPGFDDPGFSDGGDGVGAQAKSRLISMLDEVYRKYKQYYQQLQAVVASFESIPGLNNAAPFASFALKALSKHFKCLKASITDQLRFISKAPGSLAGRKHGHEDFGESDKFVVYNPRPVQSTRIMDNQPVWRPQRGLPERAVSVLRAWLFEHFLHPYPTDTDKIMLAKQTGLSRSQVSNWFINARVRLWKPMVEEIHALETRQQGHQHKGATAASSHTAEAFQIGQQTNNNKDHHYLQIASASSQTPDHARTNPSSSNFKSLQDIPPEKRVRNELAELPLAVHHHGGPQQLNMDYGPFGVGSYSNPHQGGDNGVSLTLALHQNNHGINGLLDPFPPLALAHRYGLPGDGDGCMVGNVGFEPQNRHFSSRDVMGGQLLHDFVKF